MPPETKKSKQTRILKARRINIDQGPDGTDINPSSKITKVMMKNVGVKNIKVNFDDDVANNYWLLEPNKEFPGYLYLTRDTVIHCRGVGGDSILELILSS